MFKEETQERRKCAGCGKSTKKKITGDEFADIYLTCKRCEYREYYDGEPLTMLMDGKYA